MGITAEQLVYELVAKVGPFEKEMEGAATVFNRSTQAIESRFRRMDSEIERASKRSAISIKGLVASAAGLIGAREAIQYADAWKKAGNALISANVPAERQAATLERLYQQSQTYSIALGAQTQLYGATSRAAKQLTNDQEDLFRFTEAVAAALKVDGKSAGEASGALTQLGQLLRGTNVQAEEFNSLIDGAPALLEAAAKGIKRFNGDVGALIKAAKSGGLTSKEFFAGVIAGSDELKKRVDASADTFEGAFTKIENALTRYIGQTDDSLSASARLIAGLNAFADNFNEIADVVLKVGAIISGFLVGRALSGLVTVIPLAIASFQILKVALAGSTAAAQFFTSAATGSGAAANFMGLAFGNTARGAAAAAQGIGLATAAARVFRYQLIGLAFGPVGALIGALAVTFIDFSGGVDDAGASLEDATARTDRLRKEMQELGISADKTTNAIEGTTKALNELAGDELRKKLSEIGAELDRINGRSAMGAIFGDFETIGDVEAALKAIGAARSSSTPDERRLRDELLEIIRLARAGEAPIEALTKRLDDAAKIKISDETEELIGAVRSGLSDLVNFSEGLRAVEEAAKAAAAATGEIATPFEQNRLAQQPLRDFYRQRDLEMSKEDFDKDVDKRTEEIVKAAKDVGQAISEGAARIRATEEITRERQQVLISGNSKEARDRYVSRTIAAESGGNPDAKNPNSTATGVGQFIEGTWLKLFRKYFPDRAEGMTRGAILALRRDADISKKLIEAYADENAAVLQKAGIAVTEAALHLSHFLGAGDARKVLSAAPGTPLAGLISPSAIKANPTILGGGKTVDDAIRYAERRAGDTRLAAGDLTPQEEALKDATDKRKELKATIDSLLGSVSEETKSLVLETSLMNASTTERERAIKQAELLNALKREGITIDENGNGVNAEGVVVIENLRAAVDRLSAAYGVQAGVQEQARLAQEATEDAQQRSIDAMDDFRDNSRDVLGGFISDLRAGKTASEALANALQKIADKILDTGLDALIAGIFGPQGSAGGGGAGGLIGAALSIFGFEKGGIARDGRPVPLKRFAKGGVSRSAAIFGEGSMAEAAVPLPDGRSIPVNLSGPMVSTSAPDVGSMRGRGSTDVIDIRLADDSGRMADIANQAFKTQSGALVKVSVQESMRAVGENWSGLSDTAAQRGY